MIVKVQIPLETNMPTPMVLIYNEDRSEEHQFPVSPEFIKAMKGKPKSFFHADRKNGHFLVHLNKPAEWQDW